MSGRDWSKNLFSIQLAATLSIKKGPPPVLHSSGSQQYQIFLYLIIGLCQSFVSVLKCQLCPAQLVTNLLVLFRAQWSIGNTKCPQTLLDER